MLEIKKYPGGGRNRDITVYQVSKIVVLTERRLLQEGGFCFVVIMSKDFACLLNRKLYTLFIRTSKVEFRACCSLFSQNFEAELLLICS